LQTLPIYQVDAFTDKVFSGNPAAVCPLQQWLSEDIMQKIALENNLAETAFFVKNRNQYDIRWFTPTVEVDLCGHATLAAAYVLFQVLGISDQEITFHSHRSGPLHVKREADWLTLNFPTDTIGSVPLNNQLEACFDICPREAYRGKTDYLLVFDAEDDIRSLEPSLERISRLDARGVIVTAPGDEVDFVSRFFGPAVGVPEDPVTGSAHTSLLPYWAQRLGKNELSARQLSTRGGEIRCKHLGERVEIAGQGQLYLKGEIYL
jgi:predicted PhzF superfamily epimerase YddE/YHI9